MTSYKNPDTAFNLAIKSGRLSDDPRDVNYAGRFMYVGTRNGIDLFRHMGTLEYLKS